jgi:hypothetical protein
MFTMGSELFGDANAASHTNPYRQFLQKFTPRNLKELFKWCEFMFYNSPHIYAALRKFGEYPITTITYNTSSKALRAKHEHLLGKVIKARQLLLEATLDKYVYGNSFTTMYQPFIRYLCCTHCGTLTNIQHVKYKFNTSKLTFSYTCTNCNKGTVAGKAQIQDRKLTLSRKVNFIRWDPKLMDIDFNSLTGESEYYYNIPADIRTRVQTGHKHLIDTIPFGFLEAIQANKPFKFAPGVVYHMKMTGPAGISMQWGIPPLLASMSRFHYTEVLRKSNEAIALDHLVPMRVLHPAQASSDGDPIRQMSLTKWVDSMKEHLAKWRKDPLHIMLAPVPLGATQVGGQGRALLTLGEVQEAEKSIVASLGIPIEFLYGGLTGSGMEATLRLIENQLETHIQDLLELLQWVDDKCSRFLGWEPIPVGMTKFKMTDDLATRQAVFNMWQAGIAGSGPKVVSTATIADLLGLNLEDELKRVREEELSMFKAQQELQEEMTKIQNRMREQIKAEADAQTDLQEGTPGNYNPRQVIQAADQIVDQLMRMDSGTRKSQLHHLQAEDFVLYSVVVNRMRQQDTMDRQQATAG